MKRLIFAVLCTLSAVVSPVRAQWLLEGLAVCTASENQDGPKILSYGDVAIITWYDNRQGSNDIYAQKIMGNGGILWEIDGVCVCAASGNQGDPQIASDGAGGAIITWWDQRNGNNDIFAQRIDMNGTFLWMRDGVPINLADGNQHLPQVIPDGAGGAVISWVDKRDGDSDIYVQRIGSNGNVRWPLNGVALSTAEHDQYLPRMVPDGSGGAIVVWVDNRDGNNDIYAGGIDASGSVSWVADGVPLCTEGSDQWYPRVTADGSGGAVVAWRDRRRGDYDIYAQRVDAGGSVRWNANGIAVCTGEGGQYYLQVCSDGAGGAIITWDDYRLGNWDIYAQKVNASGGTRWKAGGTEICRAIDNQRSPRIVADGAGGAIITWRDPRLGKFNIYTQKIDRDGITQWDPDGVAVCTELWKQWNPQIASDGAGGAIITWEDYRHFDESGGTDIYATRITHDGNLIAATFLRSYSYRLEMSRIVIEWTLAEAGESMRFVISRAEGAGAGRLLELFEPDIIQHGLSYMFMDDGCANGTSYSYRVEVIDEDGLWFLFETGPVTVPALELTLDQNRPNPFNPSTTITYYLPRDGRVTLDIFDVSGRMIRRLVGGVQERGPQSVTWNGTDCYSRPAASGVYFYRLQAGKQKLARKIILLH